MTSNTNLDLTGERTADTAIKSMASSLATHPVAFKNEHGDEWDAEFGEITALYATENHELMMEAELDPDHYFGNVDNTSDLNKPISTATQAAPNAKSDDGHNLTASEVTDFDTEVESSTS